MSDKREEIAWEERDGRLSFWDGLTVGLLFGIVIGAGFIVLAVSA